MQEINLLNQAEQSGPGFSINLRPRGRVSIYFVLGLLSIELLFFGFLFFSGRQVTRRTQATEQHVTALLDELVVLASQVHDLVSSGERRAALDTIPGAVASR